MPFIHVFYLKALMDTVVGVWMRGENAGREKKNTSMT